MTKVVTKIEQPQAAPSSSKQLQLLDSRKKHCNSRVRRNLAKDATRSQIHQLIAENNDESLPVFVALKPILDRRDDLSRRKAAEQEKLAAWNGSKQSQRTTMIKRRSKNKQAVDYIKDEKAFLKSLKKKP